jgi:hypothetical protein
MIFGGSDEWPRKILMNYSENIKEIEKKFSSMMNNCPNCGAKGSCNFLGYGIDGEKFRVGCSNMENCGLSVPDASFKIEYNSGWKGNYVKISPRTVEEMVEIWNRKNNENILR